MDPETKFFMFATWSSTVFLAGYLFGVALGIYAEARFLQDHVCNDPMAAFTRSNELQTLCALLMDRPTCWCKWASNVYSFFNIMMKKPIPWPWE
jgi:hypothetical protein